MDKVWKEIKVTLDSLQTADIDLVNYYLNEAGAVGNEIKYAQGYLETILIYLVRFRKKFLKTI